MLKARLEEHAKLAEDIATKKGRQERIAAEVEELFAREGEGEALLDGCAVDEFKTKLVCGETSDFDKIGFMRKHGLTEEDFQEFTNKKPSKPYVRITPPKKRKGEQ